LHILSSSSFSFFSTVKFKPRLGFREREASVPVRLYIVLNT
jgi:hypothetical protein